MPSRKRIPPKERSVGRRPKICPEIIDVIGKAIENGVPQTHAAKAAGVTKSAFLEWESRGWNAQRVREEGGIPDESELVYEQFSMMLEKSRSAKIVKLCQNIEEAGRGGYVTKEKVTTDKNGNEHIERTYSGKKWQASAWLLERTESQNYSLKHQVEHTGRVEQVNVNLIANIPESQALQIGKMLAIGNKQVE